MEFSAGEFHRSSKLMIESRGVLNTGREDGEKTASNDVWRKSNAIPCNACAELEIVDFGWQLSAKSRRSGVASCGQQWTLRSVDEEITRKSKPSSTRLAASS